MSKSLTGWEVHAGRRRGSGVVFRIWIPRARQYATSALSECSVRAWIERDFTERDVLWWDINSLVDNARAFGTSWQPSERRNKRRMGRWARELRRVAA